jgi:hypothetical protein
MTPEQAAAILGVTLDASAPDIERAYRRRARTVHPDRLVGASRERVDAASAEFARVTLAREVLVRELEDRPIIATLEAEGTRPTSRWLVAGWLVVLCISGVISFYGGAIPYSVADVVLRLLPLAAAATAFAFSGRRVFYRVTLALLAASVLITLAFAAFGSLVSLALLLVPVIGLIAEGRKQAGVA